MHGAQRKAWLALRVVEFEQQIRLDSQRFAILAAHSPYDLASVLGELQDLSGTGSVSGGTPTMLWAVVSLKSHLLQLAGRTEFPKGWQTMTGGERLWSVNVSILGDGASADGESTFGHAQVRKSNTFFSQWCDADTHDEPYQSVSNRPKLNLLLDPYSDFWNPESLNGIKVSSNALDDYTAATVTACFGITRAEMEDELYYNGDSPQLAGRGVIGDYSLFIQQERISL